MKNQSFYITTTLPYVNAEPHIGFALEIVTADVISRFYRSLGHQVIFNTGTDEHGQKIYQRSQEEKQDPQTFVDYHARQFSLLKDELNLSFDRFLRTTDPQHILAAQHFWQLCLENGYIYKNQYKIAYCVGCELEKQASELDNERCALHPNLPIEYREEENYFFKFSAFEEKLLALYKAQPDFVKPEGKMREIESFVKNGLHDFSISRLKTKMPWGIEVPNDPNHVMYVWFDALVSYISTLGWPTDQTTFAQFWPALQIAGKDNLRQQSAMWQAMLLAAKLPPSKQILINGFISIGGQKMSKSLGNVISPSEMVLRYGTDATRFLLLSLGPVAQDMDVTWERFDELYTATLANGIGNVCSRVAKLASQIELTESDITNIQSSGTYNQEFAQAIQTYDFPKAIEWLLNTAQATDSFLSEKKPWLADEKTKSQLVIQAMQQILVIAQHLAMIMPDASQRITTQLTQLPSDPLTPLFPRLATPLHHV